MTNKDKLLDAEALAFHANDRPGKFQIAATKPLTSQHDLSLAYSPGVAAPVRAISENPRHAGHVHPESSNAFFIDENALACILPNP